MAIDFDSTCLVCGIEMDAVTGIGNESVPSPGDVSICFYCGHVAVYNEKLGLRNMEPDESLSILSDPRVKQAVALIKQRL